MSRPRAIPAPWQKQNTFGNGGGTMRTKVWLALAALAGLLVGVILTLVVTTSYERVTSPDEEDVAAPLRSFLEAAATGNDSLAAEGLYQGQGRRGPIYNEPVSSNPDLYFGYADLEVDFSFNERDAGYIQGSINYHNGTSKPITVVVRKGESGWGVYQLWAE